MPVDLKNKGFDFNATFKQAENKTTPQKKVEKPKEEFDFNATFQAAQSKKKVSSKDATEISDTFSESDVQNSRPPAINRIKTPNNDKIDFYDFTNSTEVNLPDGSPIKVKKTVAFTNPDYAAGVQQRMQDNTLTSDDIFNLSQATGKSQPVLDAYIKQGKRVGFAVENLEKEKKTKDQLVSTVGTFNKQFGKNYNPDEILGSAEKTAQFLHDYELKKNDEVAKSIAKTVIEERNKAAKMGYEDIDVTDIQRIAIDKNKENLEAVKSQFDLHKRLLNDHIVNATIAEGVKNGTPKDQIITQIAARTNPKDFAQSIKATIPKPYNPLGNPVEAAGQAYDYLVGTEDKVELMNTVKGEAELQYNDAIGKMAINKISQGIVTNDNNLVQQGQAELSNIDENVIYKYPSLVKQEIARRVSETLAREAGQLEGSETNDLTQKILGNTTQDIERVMKDLGYLDNPQTKDLALSMLDNPKLFSDASYLGSVKSSFLQPFKELGLTVGDISGFRNELDLLSDKKREEIFPKELDNLKSSAHTVRNILNTTANLAGMATIAAATEAIGGAAGLTASASKSLGAYTSFGLPSYDAALKDSYNFIDNDAQRALYATITAITNAEGGRLLDLGKITRIPGVSENFAKMAKGLTEESLTKTGLRELLGETKNKYIDFAVKYGKNVTKGAATMAYFNISNNIERLAFGDDRIKSEDILPQAGNAFLDGVLGMSIMGAFGAVSDMRNEKNTTYKGTIYSMALNHDATADIFKQGLDRGEYTQQEYNQKIQMLNTAKAAKGALDLAQMDNSVLLNENQKAVYVANKTAIEVLRKKLDKDAHEDESVTGVSAQIKNLEQQNRDVLAGLKFSPTLEPLYDLFDAEKKYNESLEEVNNGTGNYDKVEAAKNNYDALVNKYFTVQGQKEALKKTQQQEAVKEESEPATPKEQVSTVSENIELKELGFKDGVKEFQITENGNNIGKATVLDNGDTYQIEGIELNESKRGKGLGTKAYKYLINKLDKPLISDPSLTSEAKGVWEKLVKEGFAEKFTETVKVDTDRTKKEFTRERYKTVNKSEPNKSLSTETPTEQSGKDVIPLTKEAEDLLASIGEGSKPTFITKNLERIAKDNGIEVTGKMSADDVINALKEKQQSGKEAPPPIHRSRNTTQKRKFWGIW